MCDYDLMLEAEVDKPLEVVVANLDTAGLALSSVLPENDKVVFTRNPSGSFQSVQLLPEIFIIALHNNYTGSSSGRFSCDSFIVKIDHDIPGKSTFRSRRSGNLVDLGFSFYFSVELHFVIFFCLPLEVAWVSLIMLGTQL